MVWFHGGGSLIVNGRQCQDRRLAGVVAADIVMRVGICASGPILSTNTNRQLSPRQRDNHIYLTTSRVILRT